MKRVFAGLLSLLSVGFSTASGDLPKRPTLTLAAARGMIGACEAKAAKAVSIAVLDDGGHLIAFDRIDGALWSTIEASQGKARTALMTGQPSRNVGDRIASGAVQMLTIPRGANAGGLPIWSDGSLVGAIGVGGSLPDQDEACARAGVDAAGLAIDRNQH